MTEPGIIFRVEGRDYDITDLTGDEVEAIEEEFDCPFADLDFGRQKTRRLVLFPLLKRERPDLTMEDMGKIKVLKDLLSQDVEEPGNGVAPERVKVADAG